VTNRGGDSWCRRRDAVDEVVAEDQHGENRRSKKLREEEAKNDQRQRRSAREKIVGREKTLISGSVYHIMNNTCIHLRTRGLDI
jgi:hypothetical protein